MGKIKWHILGLLLYSTWAIIWDYYSFGKQIRMYLEFDILLMQFWVFYTAYFTCYFFFEKSKKLFAFVTLILSLFGTYSLQYFYVFLRNFFYQKTPYIQSDIVYRASQAYTHTFFVGVGFYFLIRFLKKEKENKILLEKNLTLQKNLLQSENDFLRAQINPHFLYNSLNYFYAETFETLPEVGDSIMLLGEIMRYSLTDFSASNGLANVADELQNIQNIIKINEGRFNKKIYVKLIVNGKTEDKKIVPMMLVTLVENLFKHGNLQDAASPAQIECTIDEGNKKLIFTTRNKKSEIKSVVPGGLGTNNIKKRLELLYGNNFDLSFSEESTVYYATLEIPYFNSEEAKNHITIQTQLENANAALSKVKALQTT
jgi:two-component system, LytTR family, sensor kinase